MTRTIYNPETQRDHGWPRADDADVQGLQPPLVVLDVVEHDPPDVPDGFRAERTRVYDLQAAQRIDGWELVELPPQPEPEPEPRWVEFGLALAQDAMMNGLIAGLAGNPTTVILERMISGGLLQAAEGNPRTFQSAWSAGLAAGAVSPAIAAHAQGLAEQFDLPAAFLEGLNPPTP